jgi:cell filamentation protein
MSDKYGAGQDPYCYPGSDVLRNKLDIRDDATLSEAEEQLSAIAASNVDFSPPPYSFRYLQGIHRTLFSDIYEWAGEPRTVGISKQETRFCQPEYMEREAGRIFERMAIAHWFEGMDRSDLIIAVADVYSDQRILFEHLIMNAGFEISWWGIDADEWIYANIEAFNCNLEPMERVFERCIGRSIQL